MRTEFVIPFAFDTTPLEKVIQNQGEQEVKRIIEDMVREGVKDAMPKKSNGYAYMSGNDPKLSVEIDWRKFVENRFDRWLDQHQQEIIDEAALLMAAKGSRKKAWREVLAEVKADEGKQQE